MTICHMMQVRWYCLYETATPSIKSFILLAFEDPSVTGTVRINFSSRGHRYDTFPICSTLSGNNAAGG